MYTGLDQSPCELSFFSFLLLHSLLLLYTAAPGPPGPERVPVLDCSGVGHVGAGPERFAKPVPEQIREQAPGGSGRLRSGLRSWFWVVLGLA